MKRGYTKLPQWAIDMLRTCYIPDVAAEEGISKTSIYDAMRGGKIKATTRGKIIDYLYKHKKNQKTESKIDETNETDNEKYLTVDEVADLLKCSVRTVNYLRTNEGFPCVKLARLVRFSREAVQTWLDERHKNSIGVKSLKKDKVNPQIVEPEPETESESEPDLAPESVPVIPDRPNLAPSRGPCTCPGFNSPLQYQVGGDHYRRFNYQPVMFFRETNLDFDRANAIKYLARVGHKGDPVEDLEKAAQYLQFYEVRRMYENSLCEQFVDQIDEVPIRHAIRYLFSGEVTLAKMAIDKVLEMYRKPEAEQ